MAYLVYKKVRMGNECEYYEPLRVTFAGRGLIQSACRKHLGDKDVGWTVSAADMLIAGGFSVDDHVIVVDTSPNRPTVSLFEITSVSGFSYGEWTPIVLSFEQLFSDAEAGLTAKDGTTLTTDMFKARFRDGGCERCVVRSILYLRGGYASGDWNWGGNSRTTAALLWKDAWEFFTSLPAPGGPIAPAPNLLEKINDIELTD
jgi:hypothetical protein